ncbi:hypothetical protein ISF_00738 [Cordyceps fumosorosea ARSEF 2679]|uniref:Uncharacterized protein n=1 Tax=Cordyceps fumosorosea (strain ARSEF 2679) TaxID=1081104 RepID=A0A168EI59_CORFA|nr:hypothetical protein ISF_00738 [Cordyceps fumosorosea ARSEF 2679]OAA73837.1 hypothetical protein ISF_00738 [Cordyceps fumosorosea ARSEF 2679]
MSRSLRPSAAQPPRPDLPRTPEPSTVTDPAASTSLLPQTPARPRFRLRKRTASNLIAPTKQFLASVAAADVPIPSIEEPGVLDEDMIDSAYPTMSDHIENIDLYRSARQAFADRAFSPPKTPAPGVVPLLEPYQFPDWSLDSGLSSLESSPDYESSRPSTARSTQTSSSLFSRYSIASEDLSQCVSPEFECTDRFGSFLSVDDARRAAAAKPRTTSIRTRKAPWTRSMSQHLWATYMIYLQDPKVTPFRIGKSGIPPHGVCVRVAREAKRSWRRPHQPQRSRNTTPTAESLRPASQWPHTCAATRVHLRELCKTSTGSAARNSRYNANSPTPFGRTANRYWNRRSAPPRQRSVFSGSEMAMSLSMSTSESMQPHGPLARLGALRYEPDSAAVPPPLLTEPTPIGEERPVLGSPFVAKSCGPSVSMSLADPLGPSDAPMRQNQTAGARNKSLGSPARLVESRPSSQKRRQAVLEPRRRKRPSLGTDFWTDPSNGGHGSLQSTRSFGEFRSGSARDREAGLLAPCTNLQQLFDSAARRPAAPLPGPITAQPALWDGPRRLGSPFVVTGASQSVPNRFSSPGRIEMSARRPYATVQQGGAAAAAESSANNASLANRLAYVDDCLRSINRRPEEGRRRSQSPQ